MDSDSGRDDAVTAIVEQWRERLPDLDTAPLLVLGRLERLVAATDSLLRPPFAAAGLAPGDFDVLAALRRSAPPHALALGQLARATLVTPGAITKRVDRLAAARLVTRARDPHDARGRVASLTAAGRRLTDRLIRLHMANEADLLRGLTDDEQAALAALLGKLLAHVESGAMAQRS